MDIKSILGYADSSPYRSNPYLDIQTPEGLIDMSQTGIPLYAQDETGYGKFLPPYSGMHKFMGKKVRETPLKKGGLTQSQYNLQRGLHAANNHGDFDNISPNQAREILHKKKINGHPLTPEQYRLFGYLSKGNTKKYQEGGNPYQQGGMTGNQILSYLFDDEEDTATPEENTAPSVDEVDNSREEELNRREAALNDKEEYDLAMQIATQEFPERPRNPYNSVTKNTPVSALDPDTYLKAIFGNEAGKTGVDPANVKGTASGRFGIIKAGRKDIYNKYYSMLMPYDEFEKQYSSSPTFEYGVAKKLAQENISSSKSAEEAIGRWYSPAHASTGQWDVIPRPDYGNKLTVGQYVNRALKNLQ